MKFFYKTVYLQKANISWDTHLSTRSANNTLFNNKICLHGLETVACTHTPLPHNIQMA